MKFPSLEHIVKQSFSTLSRFPFAIASAISAALLAVYLIALPHQQLEGVSFLYNVLFVLVLGIPLFTALPLVGEQHRWGGTTVMIASTAGAAVLLIYYFLLPAALDGAPSEPLLRYILYFIALHLVVAIAPFWGKGNMNGFWQYNKTLFLRILTAVLFSGVLFVGLAVALGSIDVLFGVDIEGDLYLQLFVLIGGIFNTWFFLAGIPSSLQQLDAMHAYPKGLKVFTQHILLPLVIVYLVILYLYTGKIILQWSWPEGWVAYLVLSFSVAGILALLLLHPIREQVENRWIKRFSRSYFRALIPLVILLLLAIWVRINEYGITVNRYFVLVLGLWLAGVVGYFILSKTENIKVVPASLAVVAFLISFGPWGAFSVAERSQVNRLQHFAREHNLLKEGTIHQTSEAVPFEDRREISSILHYLNSTHGLERIQPWFEQDLSSLTTSVGENDSTRVLARHERPQKIAELMGIEYTLSPRPGEGVTPARYFSATPNRSLAVDEFDWLLRDIHLRPDTPSDTLQAGNYRVVVRIAPDSLNILLSLEGQQERALNLGVDTLAIRLFQNAQTTDLPTERMITETSNDRWSARAYFHNISLKEEGSTDRLISAQFDLLLKLTR
ncbi:protein of unknown function [Fodinibius roseus]|uniref:DUF4153 domain-containing protein n=1 Tax=Fodinibius roseus TaxID=1194090 RepID=A0A1M4UEM0_9BACT|nr:DUF4153 domain-containing protein [Fodinibius roseus]SHE55124.1 protein of unknown function [Fodinibius roseus]